ncbi:MAG: hypothetical protein KTV68_00045 [Acidimicrobiia bacterium]|nr:hypothetical protein [Acidimicrobiia bacterium]MCY4433044.1 hypothetical protein [bacterium]
MLVAGSIAACSSDTNEVVVSSDPPASVGTPTPEAATSEGVAQPSEPTVAPDVTPTEAPDVAELVWTKVDLADALGADEHSTIRLESVGDGRVLALSSVDRGIAEMLVTEDSTDWAPIPVPAGFLPWEVDIIGDRWLILGWDSTVEAPGAQILFSDDQGVSWTGVDVDLDSLDGTAWIADAIVAGEIIVVVVLNDSVPPDVEAFSEDDMGNEPSMSSVHIFLSDGGPADWITEYPGWFRIGYGASDGFHLIMSGPEEISMVESLDGRQWTSTVVDYEVIDSGPDTIWTTDQTGQEFMVERFEGVYGWDQVLTLPDGISWIMDLSVGPAGVAAVGRPEAESAEQSAYDPDMFLIGWSVDGSDWEWQTLQEAFGLPEPTQDENSFTEVQVAVGPDFVLAQVQTFEFPQPALHEDVEIGDGAGQSDSTSAYLSAPISPSPPRWFIARVD